MNRERNEILEEHNEGFTQLLLFSLQQGQGVINKAIDAMNDNSQDPRYRRNLEAVEEIVYTCLFANGEMVELMLNEPSVKEDWYERDIIDDSGMDKVSSFISGFSRFKKQQEVKNDY